MSKTRIGRQRPMPQRVRRWAAPFAFALVALVALGLSACSDRSSGDSYLPPSPPVAQVVMKDYRFEHSRVLPRGRVVVRAPNAGSTDHSLTLVSLPEDVPPIAEQLRGGARRAVVTVAIVPRTPPGRTGTFAVDLAPGRYGLICYLEAADGEQHFAKGMSSEFRVQ